MKSRHSLFLKIKKAIESNELILSPTYPRRGEVKKWESPLPTSGRLVVLAQSKNGLNESYLDIQSGKVLSRSIAVNMILAKKIEGYGLRKIKGRLIPCTLPDSSTENNLG